MQGKGPFPERGAVPGAPPPSPSLAADQGWRNRCPGHRFGERHRFRNGQVSLGAPVSVVWGTGLVGGPQKRCPSPPLGLAKVLV